VVRNVSWGLLTHEADIVACSKALYLTEVEVKVSLSDWKADLKKRKHTLDPSSYPNYPNFKRQYYAAPAKLAERWQEIGFPEHWGVISVSDDGIKTLKKCVENETARKLTQPQFMQLLRLGCMRAWTKPKEETGKGSS
jgi:hypothetical protein